MYIIESFRLMYKEIKADEYYCKVTPKFDNFRKNEID